MTYTVTDVVAGPVVKEVLSWDQAAPGEAHVLALTPEPVAPRKTYAPCTQADSS
ncbi:hypothetical protein GCM10020001_068700 [Nonomuraea salmonea]